MVRIKKRGKKELCFFIMSAMSSALFITPCQDRFAAAGSVFTFPVRYAIQRGEQGLRKNQSCCESFGKVATAFFSALVGLLLLPFAGVSYFAASNLGTGRLKFVEQRFPSLRNIYKIGFTNLCLQHPWGPLKDPVAHTSEALHSGDTRTTALAKKTAEHNLDLLAVTELENRAATHEFLKKTEFASAAYDTDAAHPVHNHSGNGFISKKPFSKENISFLSFPPEMRAGLASLSALGAIVLEQDGIQFVMTHLNFGGEKFQPQRTEQMRYLVQNLDLDKPYVIMGDFNCEVTREWLQTCGLPENAQIAFPNTPTCIENDGSTKKIDNMIVSADLQIQNPKAEFLYSEYGELLTDHALCTATIIRA